MTTDNETMMVNGHAIYYNNKYQKLCVLRKKVEAIVKNSPFAIILYMDISFFQESIFEVKYRAQLSTTLHEQIINLEPNSIFNAI